MKGTLTLFLDSIRGKQSFQVDVRVPYAAVLKDLVIPPEFEPLRLLVNGEPAPLREKVEGILAPAHAIVSLFFRRRDRARGSPSLPLSYFEGELSIERLETRKAS